MATRGMDWPLATIFSGFADKQYDHGRGGEYPSTFDNDFGGRQVARSNFHRGVFNRDSCDGSARRSHLRDCGANSELQPAEPCEQSAATIFAGRAEPRFANSITYEPHVVPGDPALIARGAARLHSSRLGPHAALATMGRLWFTMA